MTASSSNSRKERLAAALKENLKRRKAQARAKASNPERIPGTLCPEEPPNGPNAAAKPH
jgi:hypothetical protein